MTEFELVKATYEYHKILGISYHKEVSGYWLHIPMIIGEMVYTFDQEGKLISVKYDQTVRRGFAD